MNARPTKKSCLVGLSLLFRSGTGLLLPWLAIRRALHPGPTLCTNVELERYAIERTRVLKQEDVDFLKLSTQSQGSINQVAHASRPQTPNDFQWQVTLGRYDGRVQHTLLSLEYLLRDAHGICKKEPAYGAPLIQSTDIDGVPDPFNILADSVGNYLQKKALSDEQTLLWHP